jgi:hypothetical protein
MPDLASSPHTGPTCPDESSEQTLPSRWSGEWHTDAERIEPQPSGQLGRCRRLFVQRVEHAEQRRRDRAHHDETGE